MKFFRNLSIKSKLIAIVLLVSVLAIFTGFTIVIIKDIKIFREDLVHATRMTARAVDEFCSTGLSFGKDFSTQVETELNRLLKAMPIIEDGYIYDEKGDFFAGYNKNNGNFSPDIKNLEEFTRFEGNFLHVYQPIFYEGKKYGSLYLRSSTSTLDQKIREYLTTMAIIVTGLIFLSYILALKLQGVISKPILELAGVTGDISIRTDYSVRVQREGSDEIGRLYEGFNVMMEQIQLREKERDKAEAERERLFEELAEKNKELEQVIYVTSHDLRSPLVNIQGFSKELKFSLEELAGFLESDKIPDNIKEDVFLIIKEDIPDSLKYILTSASKMDALLTGLLKLSRVGRMTSTFQKIDMNRLMNEVRQAFEFHVKEAGATLEITELPYCFGDEMQVNQVFSNLVNNALKYLAPDRPGKIKISGKSEDNMAIYCIEDNGIGIAKEHQKKIFEIFHRLNPDQTKGEGLGLTIVNKILGRHGGQIWVESEAGKGSKFFVQIPNTIMLGSSYHEKKAEN